MKKSSSFCFIPILLVLSTTLFADPPPKPSATVPVATPTLALLQGTANPSLAGQQPETNALEKPQPVITTPPPPPTLDVKAYLLMDASTGKVLAAFNPDVPLPPASLTKMMTSYIISMALKEGKIHLEDNVPISETAWRTGGSKMFIKVNTLVPVKDLMQGIIVDSGNDACIAMAEHVAGTEPAFVSLMNQTAAALGMHETHFVDTTGLPNPDHYSSAKDLATLARALIYGFPEDYAWYSQKWFTYNGIKQPNRNRLLWRDASVDGVKTGHTDEAGFCLVSSAVRNHTRLIAVVMGAPSDSARAEDSQRLLDYGFHFFETHVLYPAKTQLSTLRVWNGASRTVPVGVLEPFSVTVIPGQYPHIKIQMHLNSALKAPVPKGTVVGQIQIWLDNKIVDQAPLVTLKEDPKGPWWRRWYDYFAQKI